MSEKKSFWERLFNGGGCSCGMSLEEEPAPRKQPKKGGCCDMQIVEEDNKNNARHKADE